MPSVPANFPRLLYRAPALWRGPTTAVDGPPFPSILPEVNQGFSCQASALHRDSFPATRRPNYVDPAKIKATKRFVHGDIYSWHPSFTLLPTTVSGQRQSQINRSIDTNPPQYMKERGPKFRRKRPTDTSLGTNEAPLPAGRKLVLRAYL